MGIVIRLIIGALGLVAFGAPVYAQDMSGWTDKTICRLVNDNGSSEYIKESKRRGLACGQNVMSTDEKPTKSLGRYKNHSSYSDNKNNLSYVVFPFLEMGCRVVFEGKDVGFRDETQLKEYLKENRCNNLNFKSDRYGYGDAIEAGVKVDIDKDGIKDQLLFLYGFQPNTPLRMIAFKLNREIEEPTDLQLDERISPIERVFRAEEVFADGQYPKIQNARVTVADFNNDGIQDIAIADSGYDTKPRKHYPNKILLSSPEGYVAKNFTETRKSHAISSGDVDGDGHMDIILGWGQSTNNENSSRLLINRGDGTFDVKNRNLPSNLRNKTRSQPHTIELIDVDEDGYIDILSGQGCGNHSKVYWNDGHGMYDEKISTTIPLNYAKNNNSSKNARLGTGNIKCEHVRSHVAQFYFVKEQSTNKKYLGVITTENNWDGRYLSLHEVVGRTISEDLHPIADMSEIYADHEFAYKIDIKENDSGHEISIYDYSFKRLLLEFDPDTELYSKKLNNSALNHRWKFDRDGVIK